MEIQTYPIKGACPVANDRKDTEIIYICQMKCQKVCKTRTSRDTSSAKVRRCHVKRGCTEYHLPAGRLQVEE